jgi:hypothetical protein
LRWCKNPRRVASSGIRVSRGLRTRPSEDRSRLWGTGGLGERSPGLRSAREEIGRNPGQGLCRTTLEGRTPWEAPVVGELNTRPAARHSQEDQNPETEAYRAGPALRRRETPLGRTVGGLIRAETHRKPLERGNLRRGNPMSAAGVKENRHGMAGRKPSRGDQTLKAERSGSANPREVDLRSFMCCREQKPMRGPEPLRRDQVGVVG